ncbi:MAG: hypothetical protein ACJ786_36670 [Catenulispora sp.]
MTQTTPGPGAGDYGPEVAGRPGSGADHALDVRERPGFHIGSHTWEMTLTATTVLLAAVGALLIAWTGAHVIGGWLSLAGIIVGLYAQLTSDTTYERIVNVCAIGLAAVAFAFHIHHGGLY